MVGGGEGDGAGFTLSFSYARGECKKVIGEPRTFQQQWGDDADDEPFRGVKQ